MTKTQRGPAPARTGPREIAATDSLFPKSIGSSATSSRARTRKDVDHDRWTSVRLLHVEIGSRWTSRVYGGRAWSLIEHAGIPKQWDPSLRLWTIPSARVDDLLAYAEHVEGRFVTVEEVDR